MSLRKLSAASAGIEGCIEGTVVAFCVTERSEPFRFLGIGHSNNNNSLG